MVRTRQSDLSERAGCLLSASTPAPNAFFSALAQRRAEVLERLRALPDAPALADTVHAVLTAVAGRGPGALKAEDLLDRPAAPNTVVLDGATLEDMLVTQPAEHGDAVSALLVEGVCRRLADADAADREGRLTTMVRLLPGIERLGPFVLSDYVDVALTEADATLFWQIYVDRVAAEVKRRTQGASPPKTPWMLLALLRLHRLGPGQGAAPRWSSLRLHINRALRAARHRGRFIRQLAEDSVDVELLHFLCVSAAMVDDPEALVTFLERGDAKLISCALFTLQIRGGHGELIAQIGDALTTRPLPEVGARLVEIYAQLHVLPQRSEALDRLAIRIRQHVQAQVAEGVRVDSVLAAVADDPRALRQSLLLADAAPRGTAPTPTLRHLYERVIGVWFQVFTPGGVAHPLNDEGFHAGVRRAMLPMLDTPLLERLLTLGAGLTAHARRWSKTADRQTVSRFVRAYAQLVLPLASEAATTGRGEAAQALYGAIVRLYVRHPEVRGAGWLGAAESVVPAMFADLIRGRDDTERLIEAAALVAQVEAELRGASATEIEAPVVEAPLERPVIRAPIELATVERRPAASILASLLGAQALRRVSARWARRMGWQSHGEAVVTDDTLLVHAVQRRRGAVMSHVHRRAAVASIEAITVRRPLRLFHLAAGTSVLVGAAAYGGQLAYAGVRAASAGWALLGVGVIGAGLLFDAAAQRLARRARHVVHVRVDGAGEPLIFDIDTRTGAPLLDALMAADARRRELALYAALAARDTAWDGDAVDAADGPVDAAEADAPVGAEAPADQAVLLADEPDAPVDQESDAGGDGKADSDDKPIFVLPADAPDAESPESPDAESPNQAGPEDDMKNWEAEAPSGAKGP